MSVAAAVRMTSVSHQEPIHSIQLLCSIILIIHAGKWKIKVGEQNFVTV